MTALRVFLLGRNDRKSGGATSQWKGLRPKLGRSHYVKISPASAYTQTEISYGLDGLGITPYID